MKKVILILTLIASSSSFSFGQDADSASLASYKNFLPYIIKGLANPKEETKPVETAGKYYKPWEENILSKDTAIAYLNALDANKKFEIDTDYQDVLKLKFFSQLKSLPTIEAIYQSNAKLANIQLEISELQLSDSLGNKIALDTTKRMIKNNEGNILSFQSAQVSTSFPLKENYSYLKGSMVFSLNESEIAAHLTITKNDFNKPYKLGNYQVELFKVNNQSAFLSISGSPENLTIVPVNKNEETFTQISKLKIPKKIYDFAYNKSHSSEEVTAFINTFTVDDMNNASYVIILNSSTELDKIYLYYTEKPKSVATKQIDFKIVN